MSRTPIRDQFRRRPATPTTVARTTTAQGRKRNVALGLVPSQGRRGVHGRHLNPSINQCIQFSCLGVPAPAGMSDWYENDATQPQKRLNATATALVSPAPHSSFRRKPESRGLAEVAPMTDEHFQQPDPDFHTLVCRRQPARAIGAKACPGLRSGINSGAGRRHQPPSPEQRQPSVAREKCSAGACPQLRARRSFARVALPGIPRRAPVGAIRESPWVGRSVKASAGPAAWTDHHAPILSTTSAAWFSSLGVPAAAGVDGLHECRSRSRIAGSHQADGSQKLALLPRRDLSANLGQDLTSQEAASVDPCDTAPAMI